MEAKTTALVRLAAALALGTDAGLAGFRDEALRVGASPADVAEITDIVRGIRLAALLAQDEAAHRLLAGMPVPVILQRNAPASARLAKEEGDASAKPLA